MKKYLLVIVFLLPLLSFAQRDWSNIEIEVSELAPGLHRLFIANSVAVVVSHGTDGVLVVDAAYEQSAERLMQEIQKLSAMPVAYLINTHLHADHTGGNKLLGKDARIIAHPSVKDYLSKEQQRGDNITPAFPEYALPDILVAESMDLNYNGEKIQITHLSGGHTGGDLIVYFPNANVLVMGDLLFAGFFPYVDTGNGGNPLIFMENVERILEHFPSDVKIVGGHGPLYTLDLLQQWYDNLAQTFEVIKRAKEGGMTADEMKAQQILKEWKEMGSFFITEDRWIDTLYPYL